MKKVIFCAVIASLLAACSSTPIKSDDNSAAKASDTTQSTANTNATTGSVGSSTAQASSHNTSAVAPVERSVYFDYDKYDVNGKYSTMIMANATYLQSHPDVKVKLEGNTDERGGAEYNLALGQKRAEAVRKMMAVIGVADKQMEAISFGKEKPKAIGSNEASWAENRRTDIHYQ